MSRRSRNQRLVGGGISLTRKNFDRSYAWHNRRTLSQDAQKGRPARPQRVKGRGGPSGVRSGSERCENAAGGLFQHPAVAVCSRREYHPLHATYLDAYRPARRALPHRSQYHPAHTGCNGGRPNRMDALSPCISYRARGSRTNRMDLDRYGLRHVWNGGIGLRPCHSHEHPRRTR
jgi:hypothetical protein